MTDPTHGNSPEPGFGTTPEPGAGTSSESEFGAPREGGYGSAAPPSYATTPPAGGTRSNGPAIAALVTGIIALLLSWIPGINLISFVLGIVAIITGVIGRKKAKEAYTGGSGMATAGLVTGGLALVLGVLVYVGIASFISNNPDIQQELERQQQELEEQQNG